MDEKLYYCPCINATIVKFFWHLKFFMFTSQSTFHQIYKLYNLQQHLLFLQDSKIRQSYLPNYLTIAFKSQLFWICNKVKINA